MNINYSLIGLDNESSTHLINRSSSLLDYKLVGNTQNTHQLLDIILSETPDLICINVDNFSLKKFIDLTNTITDLYRSFCRKPFLVAIASSKKQAFACIKNNFFYYLLRPIDEMQMQKLDYKLHTALIKSSKIPKQLCLQTYGDYRFIEIKDILFLKADNNSTEFFMNDNTKIVAFKTLKHFETILPNFFSRIHQSFVINKNYVSRIHLGKSECHLKQFKTRLPFSKSYRKVMTDLATMLSSNALN
ncbi:MAG: LytR/AlgR family response regulator transcription factor [Maribacter sp.]